ncbi:putative copper homeostasis (lipo)protein LpqS [Mycobacterium riyadhense]
MLAGLCRAPRLRTVVAAIVAAWLVFGAAGVHCGIPRFDQALSGVAIAGDQAHLMDGSASPCQAKFATPALAPASTSLVALGVVAMVGIVTASLALPGSPGGRSPPVRCGFPVGGIGGRDRLSRFCLARR